MGPLRSFQLPSLKRASQDSSDQYPTPRSSQASSPSSATFSLTARTSASSVSSVTSSPPVPASPTFPLSTFASKRSLVGGLPNVVEDPMEPEVSSPGLTSHAPPRYSLQQRRSHDIPRTRPRTSTYIRTSEDMNDEPSYFDSYGTSRRRSGEQTWTAFANGVKSKLGSLSRKSSQINADVRTSKPTPSPSPTFSRSRAASRPHSRRTSFETDAHEPQLPGPQIETIIEDDNQDEMGMSLFPAYGESQSPVQEMEEIERRPTPLLPRFTSDPEPEVMVASPVQSPTILPHATPFTGPLTPADSPKLRSPALSQHASTASMRKVTLSKRMSDIVPLSPATQTVDWASKLGHEDFDISPEPYMPGETTRESHDQLLCDWNKARFEFSKHRSRTESNFSPTSTIYRLTEDKWASIDAQWRAYSEALFRDLCESGQVSYPSPREPAREPAPVRDLTDINDPRLVQPLDIVGPMVQEAPRLVNNASKRENFFSMMRAKARGRRSLSGAQHPMAHRTTSGLYYA